MSRNKSEWTISRASLFRGLHTFLVSRFVTYFIFSDAIFTPIDIHCSGKRVNWELYNFLLYHVTRSVISCSRGLLFYFLLFVCWFSFLMRWNFDDMRFEFEIVSYGVTEGKWNAWNDVKPVVAPIINREIIGRVYMREANDFYFDSWIALNAK